MEVNKKVGALHTLGKLERNVDRNALFTPLKYYMACTNRV